MKSIPTLLFLVCAPALLLCLSCEKKGPAEKAGEKVDEVIESVEEAVTPE